MLSLSPEVLSHATEIDILFTYRAGDREGSGRTEEADGIPYQDGGNA